MNDTQVNALMQLVPERFLDEAMDYHEAHAPKELFMPSAAKNTVPRRMLWIAAPVSAAACLAAVIGLCYVIGTRQPERPVESLQNEIIEEQPSAVTGTTAAETDAQRSTAATTHTETKSAAVTVTSIVSGTAAQSGISEEPAATAAETAQQIPASDVQTEAEQPAVQTETEPLPTIAGRPYDPEIVAQYQLGDVNMDGVIDDTDFILIHAEYNAVVYNGGESILTPEQLVLADIVKDNHIPLSIYEASRFWETTTYITMNIPTDHPVSFADFAAMLDYYTRFMVANRASRPDVVEHCMRGVLEHDFPSETSPLEKHYGWRYIDESEETVFLPELGTLPVHNEDLFLYGYSSSAHDGTFFSRLYYCSGTQYVLMVVVPDEGNRPDKEPLSVTLPDRELTVDAWYFDAGKREYFPSVCWYQDGKSYEACFYQFESDETILELLPRLIGSTIG